MFDCYICGNKTSHENINGIDRIDSNKSYCIENCKACCATCNYLKNDLDIKDFMIHLVKIGNYSIYDGLVDVCDASPSEYNKNINSAILQILEDNLDMYELLSPYQIESHNMMPDDSIESVGVEEDDEENEESDESEKDDIEEDDEESDESEKDDIEKDKEKKHRTPEELKEQKRVN
jgi:hypothetical protein